jgi:hypothetical protein
MAAANELIGVSTIKTTDTYFSLRFHLGDQHLARFSGAERFEIRGQAANGFIIAPNKKGLKVSFQGLKSGGYLQTTLANFDLSKRARKRINVRPEFENGHIRVPPLPPAWIDASAEFSGDAEAQAASGVVKANGHQPDFDAVFGERATIAKLHADPGSGVSRLSSESTQLNGSPTAPPPKPTLDYAVPVDASMAEMQAQLAVNINAARELIRQMEARTGMKFVLDRNLRLVVAL